MSTYYTHFTVRALNTSVGNLSADHHMKNGKGLNIGGVKFGTITFGVFNGAGQIVIRMQTTTTSYRDPAVRLALGELSRWMTHTKQPLTSFYIDNPNADESSLKDSFPPCQPKVNNPMVFKGKVVVYRLGSGSNFGLAPAKLQSMKDDLDRIVSRVGVLVPIVGLDAEWVVSYVRGAKQRPTSTIQLCIEDFCIIFHIKFGVKKLPKRVVDLLENASVLKPGLVVSGDAKKLQRDFGVSVKGSRELEDMAKEVLVASDSSRWSLGKLVSQLFGQVLSKTKRLSNWENFPLDASQVLYAATDAYAHYMCYRELRRRSAMVSAPASLHGSAGSAASDRQPQQVSRLVLFVSLILFYKLTSRPFIIFYRYSGFLGASRRSSGFPSFCCGGCGSWPVTHHRRALAPLFEVYYFFFLNNNNNTDSIDRTSILTLSF
jgi:hypothetical protein